jgi:hypothetical protein
MIVADRNGDMAGIATEAPTGFENPTRRNGPGKADSFDPSSEAAGFRRLFSFWPCGERRG